LLQRAKRSNHVLHCANLMDTSDAGTDDSVKLVTALLQVSAFPDDDICSMSLNFWHRFARFLTDPIGRQHSIDGGLICCGLSVIIQACAAQQQLA